MKDIIKAITSIEKSIEYLNKVECTIKTADALEIGKLANSMAIDSLRELEKKLKQLL